MEIKFDEKYNLSEEAQSSLIAMFSEKLETETKELKENLELSKELLIEAKEEITKAEEEKESKTEDEVVAEKVKLYEESKDKEIEALLDEAVAKFIVENEQSIVDAHKLNWTENFMEDVQDLFDKYNVSYDTEKRDALKEAYTDIEILESKVQKQDIKIAEAKALIEEVKLEAGYESMVESLSELDKEKVREIFEKSKSLESVEAFMEASKKPTEEEDDSANVDDIDLEDDEKTKTKKEKNTVVVKESFDFSV